MTKATYKKKVIWALIVSKNFFQRFQPMAILMGITAAGWQAGMALKCDWELTSSSTRTRLRDLIGKGVGFSLIPDAFNLTISHQIITLKVYGKLLNSKDPSVTLEACWFRR